jgi:hypothetical protein
MKKKHIRLKREIKHTTFYSGDNQELANKKLEIIKEDKDTIECFFNERGTFVEVDRRDIDHFI